MLCLGRPVDRCYPVGLRTLYPLTRDDSVEAIRRWVRYQLPEAVVPDRPFAPPSGPPPPA